MRLAASLGDGESLLTPETLVRLGFTRPLAPSPPAQGMEVSVRNSDTYGTAWEEKGATDRSSPGNLGFRFLLLYLFTHCAALLFGAFLFIRFYPYLYGPPCVCRLHGSYCLSCNWPLFPHFSLHIYVMIFNILAVLSFQVCLVPFHPLYNLRRNTKICSQKMS